MSIDNVPVNEPVLDGNEERYLLECIRTGWISSEGPFVREFEQKFAARVGRRFGIAVCNGTAALEVALAAAGIGPGDEVILPSFTIISCVLAVVRCGAIPVTVDCDPLTWNLDVSRLEECITSRTRAIMPVHIYGLPVDMDPLLELARRHGLAVIEDAAQAHGLSYRGLPCGSFGSASCFSFYPNKHVTTGEGGMVVTNDEALAERCRSLRNLCFGQGDNRFVHEALGWNYRMTNLQAALGVAQLERLDQFVLKKRAIGERYRELLAGIPAQFQPARTETAQNINWVFGMVLDDAVPFAATEVTARLGALGIGTRPFFWPMHEQPVLRERGLFAGIAHPVAERIARRGFYLPSGLALSAEQQERVCAAVREVLP